MTPISRGFGGRRRDDVDFVADPAGPVLRAGLPGPVGRADAAHAAEEWTFSIQGAVDEARSWTWDEFTALMVREHAHESMAPVWEANHVWPDSEVTDRQHAEA